MSLVIPPGYGSAAFVLTGQPGTQPYVTTCGVDLSSAGGDWVAAANACFLAFEFVFKSQLSQALTLDHVTLTVGSDGPGGSVDSDLAPSSGTRTGSFPPTALSTIARKTTNTLGRRGRGRMFIPGIVSENEVDEDGTIVTARRNAINALLATFHDELSTGDSWGGFGVPPVLLHGPAAGAIPPTPITRFTVSDTVGWIRGRIR